jgi:hypothetical protein
MIAALNSFLMNLEPFLCLAALVLLCSRRAFRQYRFLGAFLGVRFTSFLLVAPLFRPGFLGMNMCLKTAYIVYFYVYWTSYLVEALLGLGMIVSIFKLAMEPLPGLRQLGMLMFKWAAAVSVAIALSISFGPQVSSQSFMLHAIGQLQRTESVLTLCLLLFVCFAIRPMGLTVKSRIFGVSLGLGLLSATDLIEAAWLPRQSSSMYTVYSAIGAASLTLTLLIWIGYFAFPEPRRRMILLPTTSPFFRWNQISEALGDAPGYVALGQVTSDMFAPAEIELMRRASYKMGKAIRA